MAIDFVEDRIDFAPDEEVAQAPEEEAAPATPALRPPVPERPSQQRPPTFEPRELLPQTRLPTLSREEMEFRQTPLVKLPDLTPWQLRAASAAGIPGAKTVESVARAGLTPVKELVEAATSPEGIAMLPALIAAPAIAGPALAATMLPEIPHGIQETAEAAKAGDVPGVVESGVRTGLLGLMTAGGLAAPFAHLPRAKKAAQAAGVRELPMPPIAEDIAPLKPPTPRPPKIAAVELAKRRAEVKAARPTVPETPAETRLTIIEEIRRAGADTKEKVRALFPQLSREEAGKLRDQAFPSEKVPDNLSKAETERVFELEKLNEEANKVIEKGEEDALQKREAEALPLETRTEAGPQVEPQIREQAAPEAIPEKTALKPTPAAEAFVDMSDAALLELADFAELEVARRQSGKRPVDRKGIIAQPFGEKMGVADLGALMKGFETDPQAVADAARATVKSRQAAPEAKAPEVVNLLRDESGNPLTVYHGTPETSFKPSQIEASDWGHSGPGIYLTTDPKIANVYATGHGASPAGRVLTANIVSKKPFGSGKFSESEAAEMNAALIKNGYTPVKNLEGKTHAWLFERKHEQAADTWDAVMKDAGYDSVRIPGWEEGEMVVYDPSQIVWREQATPKAPEVTPPSAEPTPLSGAKLNSTFKQRLDSLNEEQIYNVFEELGYEINPDNRRIYMTDRDNKKLYISGEQLADVKRGFLKLTEPAKPPPVRPEEQAELRAELAEETGEAPAKAEPVAPEPQQPGLTSDEIIGMGGAVRAEFEPTSRTATGIKNATVERERAARGLPPAMQAARRSRPEVWDRAMAEIDRDPAVQDKLIGELRERPRALEDTEVALLLHRQIDLQNEYGKATRDLTQAFDDGRMEDVEIHKARVADWSGKLLDLYNIGKSAGTATGRGLDAHKMMANEDFTLASMETEMRVAKGGKKLTDAERSEMVRIQTAFEKVNKELEGRVAALEKELAEAQAGRVIEQIVKEVEKEKKERKPAPRRPEDQIDRTEARIRERVEAGDTDIRSLIQKLARQFAEEGVTDREVLINRVHEIVADIVPEWTRRQTMDAISGYGHVKLLNKDEVSVRLRDLKGQMQQLAKLEDMASGQAPLKTGIERRTSTDAEKVLIKQVNEAKRIGGYETTDPARQLRTALDEVKERMRTDIKDMERRLREGDYEKPKRRELQLDKEATTLRFRREELKREWHEKLLMQRLAQESVPRKVFRKGLEGTNLARAIITSIDFPVLRQGKFTAIQHPVISARAIPEMLRAFASKKEAFKSDQEILNRPNFPRYQRAKLYLAEYGVPLARMEEAYMSRWAANVPVVAGSQRAYSVFLNRVRADVFDALTETLERTGKASLEEDKVLAYAINVFTGRGNVLKSEQAAVGLNTIFFAPQFVFSRFQTALGQPLYYGVVSGKVPIMSTLRARRLIAGEYAKLLTGYGILYGLAATAGFKIGSDALSTDFGKMIIGKTRVDPLAGLSQAMVLMARLYEGEKTTLKGKKTPLYRNVPYGQDDAVDVAMRFGRTKLAPVPAAVVDWMKGQDVTGKKVTLGSMLQRGMPIVLQDTVALMKDQGVPSGVILFMLALLGENVSTYEKREKD